MMAMLAVDGDSSVDSQLVRTGLDGAGRRWSVAPGQNGFRGRGWTWLDLAPLVDTQEVRGSNPLRPTPVGPRLPDCSAKGCRYRWVNDLPRVGPAFGPALLLFRAILVAKRR